MKRVTGTSKLNEAVFKRALSASGFSSERIDAILRMAALRKKDSGPLDDLMKRWYKSLQAGTPDYSIYSGDEYIAETYVCWETCSRKHLHAVFKSGILGDIRSVLDLGCGFGFTCAALREAFPEARIVGTNLPDSLQYQVAKTLANEFNFEVIAEAEGGPYDMCFASEYFEHFQAPVEHLRDILARVEVETWVIANAFGAKSTGHFDEYLDNGRRLSPAEASRLFGAEMRANGYRKVDTGFWNSRPSVWTKAKTVWTKPNTQAPLMKGESAATDGFGVLILTHGRPDRIRTITSLRSHGYTGPIVLVIDNEDAQADEYKRRFGAENVVVFDKLEVSKTVQIADNFSDLKGVVYARNASYDIARRLGWRYFLMLDDDYTSWMWCFDSRLRPKFSRIVSMDKVFEAMVQFMKDTPAHTLAMLQGGDLLGGLDSTNLKSVQLGREGVRKAMNTFCCDVERPIPFLGRSNEDTTTYTRLGQIGWLFFSTNLVRMSQEQTQKSKGGMTDLYLDQGTYVKSFYTVMFVPSAVRVAKLHSKFPRWHHLIRWNNCVPKIVSEDVRKA